MRFVGSGAEVHGVNNQLVQVAHNHTAAHGHKKELYQHEMSMAQHGLKTAAIKHLEKHAKKAHARKLP